MRIKYWEYLDLFLFGFMYSVWAFALLQNGMLLEYQELSYWLFKQSPDLLVIPFINIE